MRIFRTCRVMNISTVAVYTNVDRGALHVRYAEEAYCISSSPEDTSYLKPELILSIAKKTGAAIHPGYGFLSENADFARRCEEEGVIFIGPGADIIAKMGIKTEARKIMREAGLPIVPGTETPVQGIEEVKKVADNAAYLRMRARVHDVIGQRLSILHRYLEEGRLDDESLEQIDPLLRSIAVDLRSDGASEPKEQLDDIVHAFGLVSVQIDVEGVLPRDARVATAFLQIIREASTNATKHAQAHQVHVRLWQEGPVAGAIAHMTISNDGAPAPVSYREGTGIPGMRHVAQDLGGSLEVRAAPPFTLAVSIPLSSNATVQRRSS